MSGIGSCLLILVVALSGTEAAAEEENANVINAALMVHPDSSSVLRIEPSAIYLTQTQIVNVNEPIEIHLWGSPGSLPSELCASSSTVKPEALSNDHIVQTLQHRLVGDEHQWLISALTNALANKTQADTKRRRLGGCDHGHKYYAIYIGKEHAHNNGGDGGGGSGGREEGDGHGDGHGEGDGEGDGGAGGAGDGAAGGDGGEGAGGAGDGGDGAAGGGDGGGDGRAGDGAAGGDGGDGEGAGGAGDGGDGGGGGRRAVGGRRGDGGIHRGRHGGGGHGGLGGRDGAAGGGEPGDRGDRGQFPPPEEEGPPDGSGYEADQGR